MNKFTKTVLLIIGVLIILGGGILGGLYIAHSAGVGENSFDKTETFTVKPDSAEIKSVSADVTCAGIKFVKGSEWSIRFENVFSDYSRAEVIGNELVITSSTPKDFNFFDWKFGVVFEPGSKKKSVILVTYPEDVSLENVNIQLGIGNCVIRDMVAEKMVCQSFAGTIELDNCRLIKKSAFQLLAGSFKADDVMFRNSSVKIGAGISCIKLDSTSRHADVDVTETLGFNRFN